MSEKPAPSKAEDEKFKSEAAVAAVEAETKKFELEEKKKLRPKEKEIHLQKLTIQLEKLQHDSRKAQFEAALAELSFNINKREEDKLLSSDRYNKVYRFVNPVVQESVSDCMMVLSRWSRLDPGCDMEVVFCSPGGSIIDGFALYDFIQDLKRKGHKVTTKTIGYAASMAGVLLQAGSERVMGKESWLLIHEASFLAMGKMGAVEDTVEWVKRMCESIIDIFAERASAKTGKSVKVIKSTIKKNWTRKDWWLSATEALDYGFCDKVE
jgi:ATP-dependent Clp protease, protease subunit